MSGLYRWVLALVVLAVSGSGSPAMAYGRSGHYMTAVMAESRLTTTTLEAIHRIVGPGDSFIKASVWADQVRKERRDTAEWHFVNIRIGTSGFDPRNCPENNCVPMKITELIQQLSSGSLAGVDQQEAVKFLEHCIGDQSQPLHNANEDDAGGNGKKLKFFGFDTNLHSVWDGGLLYHYKEVTKLTDDDIAQALNKEVRPEQIERWITGTPIEWTLDSHRVGVEYVYPGWNPDMGEDYYLKSIGIWRVQVQKGGIRIAHVFNKIFDPQYDGNPVIQRQVHMPKEQLFEEDDRK